MARRFQEITEVYRQELAALARGDRWTAFLRSACRNYKLHFEEQVLVHAQRPNATALYPCGRCPPNRNRRSWRRWSIGSVLWPGRRHWGMPSYPLWEMPSRITWRIISQTCSRAGTAAFWRNWTS